MLKFQFSEKKAVEALTYIASSWPGITAFYASKVLFFAEKLHLNRYCRPIIGDTFIAMPYGPVPSTIYDFIKGELSQSGDPEAFGAALNIDRRSYPTIRAQRAYDADYLSQSDVLCLEEAIGFCKAHSFSALSNLTHQERAWADARPNAPMNYELMIDAQGDDREEIIAEARDFAAYGVL